MIFGLIGGKEENEERDAGFYGVFSLDRVLLDNHGLLCCHLRTTLQMILLVLPH